MTEPFITRFAPSPTGHLHIGHAFSVLEAYKLATQKKGKLLLRIEDIDHTRCKQEFTESILSDLKWLRVEYSGDIWFQSKKMNGYEKALKKLNSLGLTYPCYCTRKDIQNQIANSPMAQKGPEGFLYPLTCREKTVTIDAPFAIRLNLEKAVNLLKKEGKWPLYFSDQTKGIIKADPSSLGDVVLARKDIQTSYHLAVTVDDHLQNISHIVRGHDLFSATHIHRILQGLLGFKTPKYFHHTLLISPEQAKLSKSEKSPSLKSFREKGGTLEQVLDLIQRFPKN